MSDRFSFLLRAEREGIPTALLARGVFQSGKELDLLGLPGKPGATLKSVWRFQGRRSRRVAPGSSLEQEIVGWVEEMRAAGAPDSVFYCEERGSGTRLISVPFARDQSGAVLHLPPVDSSLEAHSLRLVEECPAPSLDGAALDKMRDWVSRVAHSLAYVGLGTLRFRVDADRVRLIEAIPRLTAGFGVVEAATGLNLPALQWTLHSGGEVPADGASSAVAHAIEARIQGIEPFQGRTGQGTFGFRAPGAFVSAPWPPRDDVSGPLLALATVSSGDRGASIRALLDALGSAEARGTALTNLEAVLDLLNHPWVRAGCYHEGFLAEDWVPPRPPTPEEVGEAVSACRRLFPSNEGVWRSGGRRVRAIDDASGDYAVDESPGGTKDFRSFVARSGPREIPVSWLGPNTPKRYLSAPASGKLQGIRFQAGEPVPPGEAAFTVRSFGELCWIRSASPFRIVRWLATAGDPVRAGQPVAEVE